ncbi:MAG: sugar phosphate isomerase/epimerase and 4-hydroxyphenylpyruvate protein, partial [Rhizobacter sp.]|nr:sugar phosphate isomerase/epimerase and 4-hydroxyphenylpyruvate protein [Rhizobacter sp.]
SPAAMRRSIATVSMSGTLRQKLQAIAAARFDGIELFEADFINDAGSARELKALADDLGLGIDLYQPFRDFEGMPDAAFKRSLDRAERKFDLMQTLGCPLVLVCSNTSAQSIDDAELSATQLHELATRAGSRGLRIGYEALAWGRWVNLYGQAWSIVERAAHPSLGLILDSFHTLSLRDDPTGIADIPGDKIFFLQMADAPLLAMDVLQWARHHRNFPGQGQFDCETFFEQTLRAGYTGNLSLEIFNDVFRSSPNRRTAVDAMRSLLALEGAVRKRLEVAAGASVAGNAVADDALSSGPAANRAITNAEVADAALTADDAAKRVLATVALFEPPEPAKLGGYAFIEFGLDETGAQALDALLHQFGFDVVGKHLTKATTLYRQGDIDFVVNTQPGSPARQRFDEQGATVGAIGLYADDPDRAAGRAGALLSARHHSPRGPQELDLPAFVSPGGMVVHFVKDGQTLDADFEERTSTASRVTPIDRNERYSERSAMLPVGNQASGCGLLAVDHIAMAMANEQFDTWMLFTRAVLGLERGESLELADPFGLVRSGGVANAERTLRMVLNVSLSQNTRTAHQVQKTGASGIGVHHIAMNCDDIFASVAKLRDNGVRFVPISANYYEDLLARTDLDEAEVRRMQSLDILFDSNPTGGRFLHAYTEPFADRFFFEIVQRDAYDGYGAINAPARMASQAGRG